MMTRTRVMTRAYFASTTVNSRLEQVPFSHTNPAPSAQLNLQGLSMYRGELREFCFHTRLML
jgi:hypothetical protein